MNDALCPATLGGRWRRARELRGITVNDFDRLIGTEGTGYTSRVESGKIAVVGSDKLAAVGLALRVSLDWLVRGVGCIDVEGHGADTCAPCGETSTW